jgi:hypothetical protein
MNRVYVLTTNLTEELNKNFVKNLNEEDQKTMLELDFQFSVDLVNENNNITSVIACNQINIEKMKSFLNKNNVEFTIEDATDLFLTDDKQVEDLTEEDVVEKMCKDVESEK